MQYGSPGDSYQLSIGCKNVATVQSVSVSYIGLVDFIPAVCTFSVKPIVLYLPSSYPHVIQPDTDEGDAFSMPSFGEPDTLICLIKWYWMMSIHSNTGRETHTGRPEVPRRKRRRPRRATIVGNGSNRFRLD
ncbi:hypothetical protein BD770DRAFT_411532 [Pilaira anomala]|nr:hypothetical protein BD770DRAFT_411532 [Pilaira anomala]